MQTRTVDPQSAPSANGILDRIVGKRCESRAVVHGVPCECLLDSGSQVTTISRKFYEEYLGKLPMRPLSDLLVIEGAGGNSIPYLGFIEFNLELPGLLVGVHHTLALVCEDTKYSKSVPLLVGTNVLKLVCDPNSSSIPSGTSSVLKSVFLAQRLCDDDGQLGSVKLLGKRSVRVDPGCIVRVSGISRHCAVGKPYPALLEGYEDREDGLVVGSSLVTMSGGRNNKVKVSVFNPNDRPVWISRHSVIGKLFLPEWARPVGQDSEKCPVEVKCSNINVGHVTPNKDDVEASKMFEDAEFDPELSAEWTKRARKLLVDNADVFSKHEFDIGETQAEHSIHLTHDRPIKQRSRPIRAADIEDARCHIRQLLDAKVIQESNSPYASPIVLVRKKSGDLRLTVDYREINKITVKDAYGIPQVEQAFQRLSGAKWFSAIDLKSGFYHVKLKPEHRKYTAFTCPFGLFEFLRLPQGLTNSPATFQRMMEHAMADLNLEELIAFLDDLIIFSDTLEEHESRLLKVFARLRQYGLKLNLKKCQFFRRSVRYLGHVVSAEGISTDPDKIRAVMEWPIPKCQSELKSWLGFSGYYRRFIRDYAKIAQPLTDLLKGYLVKRPGRGMCIDRATAKSPFGERWTPACQQAFETLREKLVSAPVLKPADPSLPFELHTDASFLGLGAALYQRVDDKLHPVAYASRSLGPTEKNYPVHKLEFLALKWAVTEKFSDFLYGSKFHVLTDNNPLTYIMTSAKLDACGHRWVAALSAYDFDISYTRGKENVDADALSRLDQGCTQATDNHRRELLADLSRRVIDHENIPNAGMLCQATDVEDDGPCAQMLPALVRVKELEDAEATLRPLNVLAPEDLELAQTEDPTISRAKEILQSGHRHTPRQRKLEPLPVQTLLRHRSHLFFSNGVMHKKARIHGRDVKQLVVPKKLREDALVGIHQDVGHLGFDRCIDLARERFYWVGLENDLSYHLRTCKNCILRKAPDPRAATLGSLTSTGPMDLVCIDFLSLEPDQSGKTDVLVITDHFTRYAKAIVTKNQSTRQVADVLWKGFFLDFGLPRRLHSDRGGSFTSKLAKELHKVSGVKGSVTTPYHPMGNGQVERFNRTLISMLATMDEPKKSEWSKHVKYLTHAYNCTRHDATGFSPFELMFGRQPRLPVDWYFGTMQDNSTPTVSAYVRDLKDKLEEAYKISAANAQKNSLANKERYNKRVREHVLSKGDRVLVKNVSIRGKHKLANHWLSEVHVVVKQCGGEDSPVYVVEPEGGGKKTDPP